MADPKELLQETVEELASVKDAIISIGSAVQDVLNLQLGNTGTVLDRIKQQLKGEVKQAFGSLSKSLDKSLASQQKLLQGSLKQKDVRRQLEELQNREASLALVLQTAEATRTLTARERASAERKVREALLVQKQVLEKQAEQVKEIEQKLLGTAGTLKAISKIPVLGEFLDAEEALIAAQRAAAKEGSTRIKVIGAALKSIGGSIKEAIVSPTRIIASVTAGLAKAITTVDKLATDTARNFGISKKEANNLNKSLTETAVLSKDTFITTQRLSESFKTLNDRYGTFAKFSEETLVTFTQLTEKAGLSKEAALALQDTTFLTGKGLKQSSKEYTGQIALLKAQTKLALNEKLLFEDIKNVSAATKLQLGGSATAIATAVFKARQLGLELKDLEGTSQALLNFQSSIEDELAAELLSGRQLNLEGARYAALIGDQAMLAEELAKNIGTAADFTGRTVLEQEAVAKTLGMNRESLAQILIQREALNKLEGEGTTLQERYNALRAKGLSQEQIAAQLGDENLAKQLETLSIQQRFQSILERLQEPLLRIAESLLPIVDGFASLVSHGTVLKLLIGTIATVMTTNLVKSIALAAAQMGLLGGKAKTAAAAMTASAAASVVQSAAAVPIVGWITGIAAAATLIATLTTLFKANDLYSEGTGGGGYGKRILLAPEGAFALNDKDNIIATTNPVSSRARTQEPRQTKTEVGITPSNTEIKINLNGAAIGNAQARQTYKVTSNIRAFGGGVDFSAPV